MIATNVGRSGWKRLILIIVLVMLCSPTVKAGPPPYTVWGQVTLGEGEVPFPGAEIHIDRVYNGIQYGMAVILSDWLGKYQFTVTEPAHRLKIWVIYPAGYKALGVKAPVISWELFFISWNDPPESCGPIWWIATRESTPTVTPSLTPSLMPSLTPSLTPTALTPTPFITPVPEPTWPTCTPWPTLMPLAQVLIDSINASHDVVINWGGPIQVAAYSHYEHLAMSSEIRVEHAGVAYIAQGWYGGIFYYAEDQPDTVYYTTWFGSGGLVDNCLSYVDTAGNFFPNTVDAALARVPAVIGRPTVSIPTQTPEMPDTTLGVMQEELRSMRRVEKVVYLLALVVVVGLLVAIIFDRRSP